MSGLTLSGLQAGSVSSIPAASPNTGTEASVDPRRRGGEAELSMFDEIRDPELRTAVEAAYEAWARKYPHLLEDWPE